MTIDVEKYFTQFSEPQRTALTTTFNAFLGLLPGGEVVITYGLPTIRVGGYHLISVGGFVAHNSIFPGPDAISRVSSALSGYTLSKGTVQFGRDAALPPSLVNKFVVATIASLNSRYPKKDGTLLEFYDNGHLKQQGKYRHGEMHGKWSWWRRDGSLMRTGSFREGEKTGEWVTYGRDSLPI
jgi:uncharacterized protein YdhG (YjbR/CyaY superfamily)